MLRTKPKNKELFILVILIWNFEFVLDFGFRASDF